MTANLDTNQREVETPLRRSWRWTYAVALATMIVVASGRSSVAAPQIIDFDKLAHFSIYGLLATLVARAGFSRNRMGWAVLIVSLFGMTDEWHQSFTPGRSVEVLDWVADTSGAILAVGLYRYWEGYRAFLEKPLGGGKARVEKSV